MNPAGWVPIGGPLAGAAAKFLEHPQLEHILVEATTNLLAAGPKLRLLARLARLESRSPVTSLLSVVGVVVDRGDTMVLTPAVQQ